MNAGKATQSCAANQLEEEGFCLIVLRVPDRHLVRAHCVCRLLKEVVSDPAGCIFYGQLATAGDTADVLLFHDDLDVQASGELAAEFLVAVCGRAQLVIQVRDTGDGKTTVFGEIPQKKEKGNRVGSSRQADKHTAAGRAQSVALDRLADALVKLRGQSQSTLPRFALRWTPTVAGNLPTVARVRWQARAKVGAGGQTRTADPALMRRVL